MDTIRQLETQLDKLRAIKINKNVLGGIIAGVYIFILLIILLNNVEGNMQIFTRVVASSLFYASLYFMIAAGLSIIFGLMDVLNLAQGALVTLGAYVGFFLLQDMPDTAQFDYTLKSVFVVVNGTLIACLLENFLRTLDKLAGSPIQVYEKRGTLWQRASVTVILGVPWGLFLGLISLNETVNALVSILGTALLALLVFDDQIRADILFFLRSIAQLFSTTIRRNMALVFNQPVPETPALEIVQIVRPRTEITLQNIMAIVLSAVMAVILLQMEEKLIRIGIAFIAAMAVGAVMGILIERLFIRPTYARPLYQIVITLGLGLLILEFIEQYSPQGTQAVGSLETPENYLPSFLNGTLPGSSIDRYWAFMIFVGLVMVISVQLILQYTRIGMIIRAGVQDSEMVAALGINVRLIFTLVFALGAAIAALGGITAGGFLPIGPALGDAFLLQAITVIVIGGLGSYSGTAIAAVMVGLTRQVIEYIALEQYGGIAPIVVLMLLCIFLMFKPNGLFGRAH